MKNPVKKIVKEIKRPLDKLKCARLVRKTIGFSLRSTGIIKLGVKLELEDISVREVDSGVHISFVPVFDLIGQIVSWNLDQVKVFNSYF